MNRNAYEFDPIIAEIVDNPDNQITLGTIVDGWGVYDTIFYNLQSTSTIEDLEDAIQKIELDGTLASNQRRFKTPALHSNLINYAKTKIDRLRYKFDPIVAEIVDDPNNQITLGTTELGWEEDDLIFSYLQTTSSISDYTYAIQELQFDKKRLEDERRFKSTDLSSKLISYAESRISALEEEQQVFLNALKQVGKYLKKIIRYTYLSSYGFDGLTSNTQKVTTALSGVQNFEDPSNEKNIINEATTKQHSSLGLYLAHFFGLGSRPSGETEAENAKLSALQIWRNLIGSWIPLDHPTRSQGYTIHGVLGDGDCGFTAFGTSRAEAIALLLDDTNLENVREILEPLINELFIEQKKLDRFREFISKNHQHFQLNSIVPENVDSQTFKDNFWVYFQAPNVLKAYLQYDIQYKQIDNGHVHPCILAALGKIQKRDLHIWKLDQDKKLIPNPLYHSYVDQANTVRKDLLYVGNTHFDLLDFVGFSEKGPKINDDIYPLSTWTAKKVLQMILLPIKLGIILPLNILLIPIKFFINVIRLFIEIIPFVLSLIFLDAIRLLAKKRSSENNGFLARLGYSLLIVPSAVLFAVFKLWHLLGRAFFSPTNSASKAYTYFSESNSFKIRLFGKRFEEIFSTAVGIFFMLVSVAVSITMWTILLPFAFTYLAPYAATLLQTAISTFPTIAKAVTVALQWPGLSVPLQAIGSALTAVGSYLSSTFAISTAFSFLSGFLGVQLPAMFITLALAISTIIAPAMTISKAVIVKLADLYVYWGSAYQSTLADKRAKHDEIPLTEITRPRRGSLELVEKQKSLSEQGQKASSVGDYFADFRRVDSVTPQAASNVVADDEKTTLSFNDLF